MAGAADGRKVVEVLHELATSDIHELVKKASMKTGLFKRRLVHVARRFGAIRRRVDFSSLKLNQLMKSLEGTIIMDEALKETLHKDLDMANTERVLKGIVAGEIRVVRLETRNQPSPLSRIGLERISMKSDLIPAEKMRLILIESTKARIMNEVKTFVCVSCWQYADMIRVKDLPRRLKCRNCESERIGILSQADEDLRKIQSRKGRPLSEREKWIVGQARETASLYEKFGKVAAYVLAGKRIGPAEAEGILLEEDKVSDRLFELIMDAERQALLERF